jgi:hypothetical protein
MNGEEAGTEGRAYAHILTGSAAGTSYELPLIGKYSFENVVANPNISNKTSINMLKMLKKLKYQDFGWISVKLLTEFHVKNGIRFLN